MSPTNLSENRVPYWRNNLRGELNAIANYNLGHYQGVEGLSLGNVVSVHPPGYVSHEVYGKMSPKELRAHRDPYRPGPAMERKRFDELVDHERRFGRISRTVEDDRHFSGVDVLHDNSWPFCSACLLPFVTMLNGHPGQGVWVQRIEDGDELCECCWLDEHYAGDRQKMIEHVLYDLTGDALRCSVRLQIRRGWDDDTIFYQTVRTYWSAPGLFELLRLHRVSVSESAGVILQILEAMIAKAKADERERKSRAEAARRAIWREERMSA
jgi:hypothetical protein